MSDPSRADELCQRAMEAPGLTEEDVRMIREALAAYRGMLALGRLGKALVVMLGTVAAAVAAWDVLAAKLRAAGGG